MQEILKKNQIKLKDKSIPIEEELFNVPRVVLPSPHDGGTVDNSHGGFHFRQEGEYSKKILLNVLVVESLKDA